MKTTPLARLLSLAVASHQSGNREDSHDIFDMFLKEVDASSNRETSSLITDFASVVEAAFLDDEHVAALDTTEHTDQQDQEADSAVAAREHFGSDDDDDDAAEDEARGGSLFDTDQDDLSVEDFDAELAAAEIDADEAVAANLASMKKRSAA